MYENWDKSLNDRAYDKIADENRQLKKQLRNYINTIESIREGVKENDSLKWVVNKCNSALNYLNT